MLARFDSFDSKGRRDDVDEDSTLLVNDLDPFMSDYLKILQSKAYRRLAYKTQVRCLPENPHVRTRSVHTNEVIAIATTISEKLGLNTLLCQAIAAGHDIGHTPYGHMTETVLSELGKKQFKHNIFSVVVAQHIERKGYGLNLNYETLEGILFHSRGDHDLMTDTSLPQEYNAVMYSDKIAYTFSDINDAIRYDYLTEHDLPKEINELGLKQRVRNDSCIRALIKESQEKGYVSFSESREAGIFCEVRDFMYKNIYEKVDWDVHKAILRRTYDFFSDIEECKGIDPVLAVALLTDPEVLKLGDFILRTRKPEINQVRHFGVFEILPYLKDKNIDYSNPDLGWGKKK
jgi:dGTPase